MKPFWTFARQMLRYRWMVVVALLMALVAGSSIGAGIIGAEPMLKLIESDGGLRKMVLDAQDSNPTLEILHALPDSWINALPEAPFTSVVWMLLALGIVTIVGGTANFLHRFLALGVVHRTITNIRRAAFRHVLRTPLADVVVKGPTDTISRIVSDTQQMSIGFSSMLSKAATQVARGIGGFAAAIIIDWRLTLIAVTVAPLLYTVIRRLGKKIRRASKRAMEHTADLYGNTAESLQALRVVKVYTAERYEVGRFAQTNKQVLKQLLKVRTARALAGPLVEAVTLLGAGFFAAVAIKAMMDGHLERESFLLVAVGLGIASSAFRPLTSIVADIQASAGAAERLAQLMATRSEPGHERGLPKLPRHAVSLRFESLSYAYPGADSNAISDITLDIPFGKTIAFVGPNGCGKTTLLAMVPRLFEPDSGRVLLDNLDIAEASVRSLREQIGVVTQEAILFKGTIKSNIVYGSPSAHQDDIINAAKKARAWDFIERLPDGLDTPVGEQGLTLSGGQRQRIAIARAILRKPALLILDEATSMIDADSEAKIAEALKDFGKDRTCLVVAHRLSTVLESDSIVVLDQGKLVDQGTHAELLERCKVYQQLTRTQLIGTSEPAKSD